MTDTLTAIEKDRYIRELRREQGPDSLLFYGSKIYSRSDEDGIILSSNALI